MVAQTNNSFPAENFPADNTVFIHRPLEPRYEAEYAADWVIEHLQKNGFTSCRVGGCVRDRLLSHPVHEADVATDAVPEQINTIFSNTYAVGQSFGVVIVHTPYNIDVETATFREESDYLDGRRPSSVSYSAAYKDALRRDFTVNALFYDPMQKTIYDFTNGVQDLQKGVIRAIGDPHDRLLEDHLRILRAVRFTARLRFELDAGTLQAVKELTHTLKNISSERILEELTKMLTAGYPDIAFQLLMDAGVLDQIMPELAATRDVKQPPEFHPEGDVWTHTLLLLNKLRWLTPTLAWSTLLHDVGKPPVGAFSDGRIRFPCHADRGAELADGILSRLRASNHLRQTVAVFTKNHMAFPDAKRMRRAKLRRMLGRETFPEELELHRLDCVASHNKLGTYVFLLDKIREFRNEPPVPPRLLSGQDIMALGVPQGPEIGRLLKLVEEWQLNEEVNTSEEALARVKEEIDKTTG